MFSMFEPPVCSLHTSEPAVCALIENECCFSHWEIQCFAFSWCNSEQHFFNVKTVCFERLKLSYFFCHTKHCWREEVMRVDNILVFAPEPRPCFIRILPPLRPLSLPESPTAWYGVYGGKRRGSILVSAAQRMSLPVTAGQVSAGGEAAAMQRERASERASTWACIRVCGGSEQERKSSVWQPSEWAKRPRPMGEHLQ